MMKQKAGIIITVAVVAVLVGVGMFFVLGKKQQKPEPTPTVYSQSTDKELLGELNTAKAALDTEKKANNSLSGNKKLAQAYINLAMAQYNVEDYKAAVRTYESLLSEVDSFHDEQIKQSILRGLYTSYAHDGQTQKAIDTCERLIKYLQTESKNPYVNSSIDAYQSDLRSLKKGESL